MVTGGLTVNQGVGREMADCMPAGAVGVPGAQLAPGHAPAPPSKRTILSVAGVLEKRELASSHIHRLAGALVCMVRCSPHTCFHRRHILTRSAVCSGGSDVQLMAYSIDEYAQDDGAGRPPVTATVGRPLPPPNPHHEHVYHQDDPLLPFL